MTIEKDFNRANPEQLKAISETAVPKTKKQLQSFLGLCGWLREHVARAADTLAPLTNLLKKTRWSWPLGATTAFERVKEVFSNPQPLARPDPNLPFILQTDASMKGIAAVLYQETKDKQCCVISYASAKLNDAQQRWHANEQECYAALWAMRRYDITDIIIITNPINLFSFERRIE